MILGEHFVTQAEAEFIARKEKDLKVYGSYTVSIIELEMLQLAIEQEEKANAIAKEVKVMTKKKTAKKATKKVAKKTAKKKTSKK